MWTHEDVGALKDCPPVQSARRRVCNPSDPHTADLFLENPLTLRGLQFRQLSRRRLAICALRGHIRTARSNGCPLCEVKRTLCEVIATSESAEHPRWRFDARCPGAENLHAGFTIGMAPSIETRLHNGDRLLRRP